MSHIDELTVRGFRNLHNLTLKNLGQFNLFVGTNNSGKTSVLEAISLYCQPLDIHKFVSVSRGREGNTSGRIPLVVSIPWMFPTSSTPSSEDTSKERIDICGLVKETNIRYIAQFSEVEIIDPLAGESHRGNRVSIQSAPGEAIKALKITLEYEESLGRLSDLGLTTTAEEFVISDYIKITQPAKKRIPSLLSVQLVTPIDHRTMPLSVRLLSNIISSGDKSKMLHLLKNFDRNIKGIEILSPDGRNPIPYFNHDKLGFAPISVFGDGLRRTITIAAALMQCRNGVLLIDELETAIHPQALEHVLTWLINACIQQRVQLFATTHSLETIDAVISVTKDKLDSLAAYRLDINNNRSTARRFSGIHLESIRNELGQDVR